MKIPAELLAKYQVTSATADADTEEFLKLYDEPTGLRILEVASHDEPIANILQDMGNEVVGVDLREYYPFQSPGQTLPPCNYTYIRGDFCDLEPEQRTAMAGTFDVAIAISAVEHFGLGTYKEGNSHPYLDVIALREMWNCLKPGGVCYISVPFGRQFISKVPDWRVYDRASLRERLIQDFTVYGLHIFTADRAPFPEGTLQRGDEISLEKAMTYSGEPPHISILLRMIKKPVKRQAPDTQWHTEKQPLISENNMTAAEDILVKLLKKEISVEEARKLTGYQEPALFKRGTGPLVSVLMPTRGRPKYLLEAIDSLYSLAKDKSNMEFLVKIDDDDIESINTFNGLAPVLPIRAIISPRGKGCQEIHEWLSQLASMATGDWLMVWHDDARMKTPEWDHILAGANIRNSWHVPTDICCFVMQAENCNKFLLLRRKVYETLGHFALSPHCDNWLVNSVMTWVYSVFPVPIMVEHLSMDDEVSKSSETAYATTSQALNQPPMVRDKLRDALKLADVICEWHEQKTEPAPLGELPKVQ